MTGATPFGTDADWDDENELDLADDESLPWLEAGEDAVTAVACENPQLVVDNYARNPEQLFVSIADTMSHLGLARSDQRAEPIRWSFQSRLMRTGVLPVIPAPGPLLPVWRGWAPTARRANVQISHPSPTTTTCGPSKSKDSLGKQKPS